jgi:hypothetical protein
MSPESDNLDDKTIRDMINQILLMDGSNYTSTQALLSKQKLTPCLGMGHENDRSSAGVCAACDQCFSIHIFEYECMWNYHCNTDPNNEHPSLQHKMLDLLCRYIQGERFQFDEDTCTILDSWRVSLNNYRFTTGSLPASLMLHMFYYCKLQVASTCGSGRFVLQVSVYSGFTRVLLARTVRIDIIQLK